jgi:competence ComEA-like helix-hairpin-helix protein
MELQGFLIFGRSKKRAVASWFLLIILIMAGRTVFPSRETIPPHFPQFAHTDRQPVINPIDINLADSAGFDALPGIGPVLSQRIIRYRDKSGGFDSLEKLKKVFGLKADWVDEMQPYLKIDPKHIPLPAEKASMLKPDHPIDINLATAAELESLPGIGPVLSKRIIAFREKMGGFSGIEQIGQVYGLPPETFASIRKSLKITPVPKSGSQQDISPPSPLDLNAADSTQLESLPGIGPVLAARILNIRKEIGFFYSPDQLSGIYGFSQENYQRARPFIGVTPPTSWNKMDINLVGPRTLRLIAGDSLSREIQDRKLDIRRFSHWEEIESIPGIREADLEKLRIYFEIRN